MKNTIQKNQTYKKNYTVIVRCEDTGEQMEFLVKAENIRNALQEAVLHESYKGLENFV